jgi:DnaJ-class molecular chaperone
MVYIKDVWLFFFQVPVPAGIEDGQTVRMPVGTKEVYITFKVEKSDYFTRKGADVHTDATISLAQVYNCFVFLP